MPKINILLHSFGEFESLQQVLTVLKQKGSWYSYMLADIVLYNVCYRDHLHKHGLQSLEHSRRYRNYGEAQQKQSSGVYVEAYHESYPQFDSFDTCDNRTYQNYIFRAISEPIQYWSTTSQSDRFPHCMVHENIPSDALPILYYPGDGRFFLLATAKPPTRKEQIRKRCAMRLYTLVKKYLSVCGYSLKVTRRSEDVITFTITREGHR